VKKDFGLQLPTWWERNRHLQRKKEPRANKKNTSIPGVFKLVSDGGHVTMKKNEALRGGNRKNDASASGSTCRKKKKRPLRETGKGYGEEKNKENQCRAEDDPPDNGVEGSSKLDQDLGNL